MRSSCLLLLALAAGCGLDPAQEERLARLEATVAEERIFVRECARELVGQAVARLSKTHGEFLSLEPPFSLFPSPTREGVIRDLDEAVTAGQAILEAPELDVQACTRFLGSLPELDQRAEAEGLQILKAYRSWVSDLSRLQPPPAIQTELVEPEED